MKERRFAEAMAAGGRPWSRARRTISSAARSSALAFQHGFVRWHRVRSGYPGVRAALISDGCVASGVTRMFM